VKASESAGQNTYTACPPNNRADYCDAFHGLVRRQAAPNAPRNYAFEAMPKNVIDKAPLFREDKAMKAKLITSFCVLAIGLTGVASGSAYDNGQPTTVAVDAVVVRPACFLATLVGSAVFVVALPVAAISKSVKSTAHALVVTPANATFSRPLGDMDALLAENNESMKKD
jgi:hypothetical protein